MTAPMRAISVTIGRDRGPRSLVAPCAPLPEGMWIRFQADVLAALEAVPGTEIEHRQGHTHWTYREECVTISRLWAEPTDEQMAELCATLEALAGWYDQDALVLHVEERRLVCPID